LLQLICFKKSGKLKNFSKVINWIHFEKPLEAVPSLLALFAGIVGVILLILGIIPILNGESINTSLAAPGIAIIFAAFLLAGFISVFGNLGKKAKP